MPKKNLPQTPAEYVAANLARVREALIPCRRIAVFDIKEGERLDSFEFFLTKKGMICLHEKKHAKTYDIEFFNVFRDMGRNAQMDTLLAEIAAEVEGL